MGMCPPIWNCGHPSGPPKLRVLEPPLHLWNQLPTPLRIPHPNYSSPSLRPSFEHAGLTCYILLSPFIIFFSFTLYSKPTFQKKTYPPPLSVSVCRTDLMALDRLLNLFAYRFLCFSSIFSVFNFLAHYTILID